MKSKTAQTTFPVPQAVGRTEADLIARGRTQQLKLFRETLTPRARLQVYAMMSLADPKKMDQVVYARIADIARAMGYEPTASGQLSGHVFQDIEDIGIKLRRKEIEIFFREWTGRYAKNKRRIFRTGMSVLAILQEFGFHYESEDGSPINLDEMPKDQLLAIQTIDGDPLYALPLIDDKGQPVKNEDGSIRRKRANGVHWQFNSRLAKLAMDKETSWIMFADALKILRKCVDHPSRFALVEKTLFHKGTNIEYGHEKLIEHLGLTGSKDLDKIEKAIDGNFQFMLDEGVIDNKVILRPEKYYKPTKKTGKRRRTGMVYQWIPAKRWRIGKALPSLVSDAKNSDITE